MITLSTTQLRFRRDFRLVFADLALQSFYYPQKPKSFGSHNRHHPKKKPEENQSEKKNHFTPQLFNFLESGEVGANESEQNETDPDGGIVGKAGERGAQMLKMETSERI